ncbi:MAG: 6-bladed beta-propeller [Ignavibacteria bacterium]|nr:6-bladed beta-propeller [Ignavibacteria bacterium]
MSKIAILLGVFAFIAISGFSQNSETVKMINVKYTPGAGDISAIIKSYEILPLDANPEAYVKNPCREIFADSLILIMDGMLNKIVIFNANGKYLNSISRKGRGPQEYNFINDFFFNPADKTVSVVDRDKILSYNLKGEFIKESSLEFNPYRVTFLPPGSLIVEKVIPSNHPVSDYYIRLTNKDFKTKATILPLKPLTGPGFGVEGQVYRTHVKGKSAYFFSYFGDTIYHINSERIRPAYVFKYDKKATVATDGTFNPNVNETYRYLSYFELSGLNMLFYTFKNEHYSLVFNPQTTSAKTYKTPFVLRDAVDGKGYILTNSLSIGKLIDMFDLDRRKCSNPAVLDAILKDSESGIQCFVKLSFLNL